MTLVENLLAMMSNAVDRIGTRCSAFTRVVFRRTSAHRREGELERRHREGYERHPVEPGEVSDWENEQVWIE